MSSSNPAGTVRLFKAAGITVHLHYLWFVLVGAVAYFQQGVGDYDNPAWHLAEVLTLFGIILLHEFGHALACRSVGGVAERIVLWPLGGIAFGQPPMRPGAWLWTSAAGPLVNVLLFAPLLGLAAWLEQGTHAHADLLAFVHAIALINVIILLFNLLPIYPMDGGQIVQALLWFVIGFVRALRIVALVGVVAAIGMLALFAWAGHPMGMLVAVFLGWQAMRGWQLARRLADQGYMG